MSELHAAVFDMQREGWKEQATCKIEKADPKIFILEQGYTGAEAVKYCRRCPVAEECADYARRTHSIGVFGGKLFTFRYSEPVELMPVQRMQDSRPRPVYKPSSDKPSILGSPVSFGRPSILGR